jgi:uncharacterized circularly permuted ATP-grasp superfamily protein
VGISLSYMAATADISHALPASQECLDEAHGPDGRPFPVYRELLERVRALGPAALKRRVDEHADAHGVRFGSKDGGAPFVIDPVPRLIAADEWKLLEAGLAQRARALDRFVADAYGSQEAVGEGVVPRHLLETAEHAEPLLRAAALVTPTWTHVCGMDLVRNADGCLMVLEDNCRTPSGVAYARGARAAVADALGATPPGLRDHDAVIDALGSALRAAAPDVEDPNVVLLSDGPANSAWYEHVELARDLGIPLVTLAELEVRDERLFARTGERELAVDVIYRRTDIDRLTAPGGSLTAVGAMLLPPLRAGNVAVANCFGAGVADDKLTHAYVEDLIRFHLGEEPLLPSVRTFDLNDPQAREEALDRIDELVVKPRASFGGHGIVICAHATRDDVERARRAIADRAAELVAQETILLSTHPTVCDGRLEPRHVDLRVYVYTAGHHVHVPPAALSRFALDEGALVVNSSQGGGAKDTWVMSA